MGTTMPLLDHFHPPLSHSRHWENLHSAWANALRDQLNEDLLPPRMFAEVQISFGSRVEIDVATFEEPDGGAESEPGGIAVWAPPTRPRTVRLPRVPPEVFEIRVYNDEAGPTLITAVELVSPAHKDRRASRHVFALKCASYLYQGVHLVIADVVTLRSANLHQELFRLLELEDRGARIVTPNLYAVAYRALPAARKPRLEFWPTSLAIGEPLPTMPLWLGADLVVPLELEQAYRKACQSSRITG
jgi:hypothetical protein